MKVEIDKKDKIKLVNINYEVGDNKIVFKQNASGFWRAELTLSCANMNDGLDLINIYLDKAILILKNKNETGKQE